MTPSNEDKNVCVIGMGAISEFVAEAIGSAAIFEVMVEKVA